MEVARGTVPGHDLVNGCGFNNIGKGRFQPKHVGHGFVSKYDGFIYYVLIFIKNPEDCNNAKFTRNLT